jgi:signal transduction histidine kinase
MKCWEIVDSRRKHYMSEGIQEPHTTSNTGPEDLSTSELPHLIWDLCDALFKSLGDKFSQRSDEYFKYLKPRIGAALGQEDGVLVQLRDEYKTSANSIDQLNAISQKIKKVQDILNNAEIDLVVVHFRSRRERSDSIQTWQRVLGGKLVQEHQLKAEAFFDKFKLTRHVFDKARENGILFFHFSGGLSDSTQPMDSKNENVCRIDPEEQKLMVEVLKQLREGNGQSEIPQAICKENIKPLLPDANESFADHIKQYCKEHLQKEHQGRFEKTEEAIAFVIESCIVTLSLLSNDKLKPPRSVSMVPVFVGSERVGGISFFSGNREKLKNVSRDLKIFARNLLTYLAVRESHEIEVDKRILEEISPVTHLFIHTFNKAFTTPILNISDEIDKFSSQAGETEMASDRLHAIAVLFRSFARRWGGTFPALQALVGSDSDGIHGSRPKFLQATYTQLPTGELKDHLSAVFAVLMANDIFDDRDFKAFRNVLSSLDSLERIVSLNFDLSYRVPGHRDIWGLHLLNLMQNSLEALPLREALWPMRNQPEYISPELFKLIVSSTHDTSSEMESVIIEIEDNGRGFPDGVFNNQQPLLSEFAQTDSTPPTIWEIQKRIRRDPARYSSKSGESYGSGLVGMADYLSRICRVRWRPDPDTLDDAGDSLTGGEILERGSVDIIKPSGGRGTVVRLKVPAEYSSGQEDTSGYRTGVFFEMRGTRGDL